MHCPNCGTELAPGDTFCGNCGTNLGQEAQPDPSQQTPPAQPQPDVTQQMPPVQQQWTQQMPPQPDWSQQQAQAQYGQQPYGYAAAPPAKSTANRNIALAVAGVLLLAGLGVGAYFLFGRGADESSTSSAGTKKESKEETASAEEPPATDPGDAGATGLATPEAAVEAAIEPDWVFQLLTDEAEYKEYMIGPPASEWTDVIVVERQPDGSWVMTDSYPYEIDGGYDSGVEEDQAIGVVGDFLIAIMENRPEDAHPLTVSPFAEDPASAQYANGEMIGYEIVEVVPVGDGSFRVHASEEWTWGTEDWAYTVVPTEEGYRISNLEPW